MSDTNNGGTNGLRNTSPNIEEYLFCINVLQDLCINNAEYFATDSSENGQRLYISFMCIRDTIASISPKITHITREAPHFDFDENTPGNGYRSFLSVLSSAVNYAIQLNKKVCLKRETTFFRKTQLTK